SESLHAALEEYARVHHASGLEHHGVLLHGEQQGFQRRPHQIALLDRRTSVAAAAMSAAVANVRNICETLQFQPSRIPPTSGPVTAPSRPSAMAQPIPVDRMATG